MFVEPDPWEEQYFYHTYVHIPVSDPAAYEYYPEQAWVYNKLALCKRQGIKSSPHGVLTLPSFPCVSKPIYNLWGMSKGAKVCEEEPEYAPGHMLMEYLGGPQISVDMALMDGECLWHHAMKPEVTEFGKFSWWRKVEYDPSQILGLVNRMIGRYNGVLNLEIIGDKIIDFHLRMSPSFVDLYGGREWLEEVEKLYMGRTPSFTSSPEGGVAYGIWSKEKGETSYVLPAGVSSVQFCTEDPEKLLMVNGWDEEVVFWFAEYLEKRCKNGR